MGAPYPREKDWGPEEAPHLPEVRFDNPNYTEDALSTLAAIYQYQAVQKSMSKWSPEDEGFLEHRGNLLRGGAEEWMFQPLPATGPERRLFFEENAPRGREELQRVFPRFWLIQPRHVQALQQGKDPFVPKEGEPGDPLVYQDVAIVDDDPRYQWAPITDEKTGEVRHMMIHPEYGDAAAEEGPESEGILGSLLGASHIPWKTRAFLQGVAPGAWLGAVDMALRTKRELGEANRMRDEQIREIRDATEAHLRSTPSWNRGYQAELLRLQEAAKRGELTGASGGFKGTFGGEAIIDKATRGGWLPFDVNSVLWGQTQKFSPESERGRSTAEELGAAEARTMVLERVGGVQHKLQELQRKYEGGEIDEGAYTQDLSSLLGLQAPTPGQSAPAPTPAPAPTTQPTEQAKPQKRTPLPSRIDW
tara:strand:- start:416 stop:1672 length:1257 start_codon:yes stop_codon:yes gene_type:complete